MKIRSLEGNKPITDTRQSRSVPLPEHLISDNLTRENDFPTGDMGANIFIRGSSRAYEFQISLQVLEPNYR